MLSDFIVRSVLVAVPAVGLVSGFAAPLLGFPAWQGWVWAAFTVLVLLALLYEIVASLRRGEVGLDIVAALSMTAALAVGENLAAIVVALMYSGGQYLEAFAERHARREMTAILARVPRTAVRHRKGVLEEVGLEEIVPGDRLLIRQGDVVPVDGTVSRGVAILDQAALTGEAIPVQQRAGDEVNFVQGRAADGSIASVRISPEGSPAANPAFDVTPARLITGLITERGIATPSPEGLKALFPERS